MFTQVRLFGNSAISAVLWVFNDNSLLLWLAETLSFAPPICTGFAIIGALTLLFLVQFCLQLFLRRAMSDWVVPCTGCGKRCGSMAYLIFKQTDLISKSFTQVKSTWIVKHNLVLSAVPSVLSLNNLF
jgi:hypothetical protein